jgi:flagellar protein FliS
MAADLYKQYQQNIVTQADPVKLVELMYEGAIKFIRIAAKAVDDQNPEAAHNNILRAYAVVAELMATLDFEQGGEIAAQLEQCYDYVLYLLKEANIKKDRRQLDQALSLLTPLLETWQQAFSKEQVGQEQAEAKEVGAGTEPADDQPDTKRDRKSLDIVG